MGIHIDEIKLNENTNQIESESINMAINTSRSSSQSKNNHQIKTNYDYDLHFKTQIFHISKDFVKVFWTKPIKHIAINQNDGVEVIQFSI